ncbi:MAG: putative metal-dependent hydrolase [Candidatus Adlerbacteria bacterium]|nr:putative metal-dependent hydrolase [Candidatus Adlerbacteria bacterium]
MLRRRNSKHYAAHKEAARALVHTRLAHYNRYYNHTLRRVFIKNSKSRWGSCSSKGNLNFSYKLLFLPPEVADYVIVHELCHLREFNHGPHFWALVAQACPEHKALRQRLRLAEKSA